MSNIYVKHLVLAKEKPYVRILDEKDFFIKINDYKGIIYTIIGNNKTEIQSHAIEVANESNISHSKYRKVLRNHLSFTKINEDKYLYFNKPMDNIGYYACVSLTKGYNFKYINNMAYWHVCGDKEKLSKSLGTPEIIKEYILQHEKRNDVYSYF